MCGDEEYEYEEIEIIYISSDEDEGLYYLVIFIT